MEEFFIRVLWGICGIVLGGGTMWVLFNFFYKKGQLLLTKDDATQLLAGITTQLNIATGQVQIQLSALKTKLEEQLKKLL